MSVQTATAGLTEQLARQVADRDREPDAAALDLATRATLDTVGVTLAAADDPGVRRLLAAVGAEHGDLSGGDPDGPSTVLVTGRRAGSREAALLGGASAHALDYDDVDDAMIGHPSAVLVPTVLAVGEQVDASGHDVLDAYWTGLLTCRTVAAAVGIAGHYAAGWHSTATLGALGAAAAAARLRGLDTAQVQHAFGVAGSLAGGSRQNFGTMTKPLHAGTAAANGVLAANLAASGFTADPHQLESPLGFLALHAGAGSPTTRTSPAADTPPPAGLDEPTLNVKLYPCCYYLHAAIDAMLELTGAGLTADDVAQVAVTVQPDGLAPLIHHRPQTGLQGKFSMEYAMAACLLDGELTLTSFTDAQVQRPSAQRLLGRVTADTGRTPPAGPAEWDTYFAVVTVRTHDGHELVRRVDRARGHASRPLTADELRGKFEDCLAFGALGAYGDDAEAVEAGALHDLLRDLRRLPSVRQVTARISAGARHGSEVGA